MGLGVVILFWCALYVLLAGFLSVIAWIVIFVAKPKRWTVRIGLIVAPFVIAGLPVAAMAVLLVMAWLAPPSTLYREVFHHRPPESVRNLQAKSDFSSDFAETYLAFEASEEVLADAVASPRFSRVEAADSHDVLPLPSEDLPPSWWTPQLCAPREVYRAENFNDWQDVVVTLCRSNGLVYVQARSID